MTPAETLRAAAKGLRADADAAHEEMTRNAYWGGESSDAAWARGVSSGLGGPAGEVAAKWTPGLLVTVARYLEAAAKRADVNPFGAKEFIAAALDVARAYLGEADTA